LLGRILAVLKQALIAFFFGASGSTDAIFVAQNLPELFTNVLGFNVMKGGIVSHFSQIDEKDELRYTRIFSSVLNFIIFVALSASILCYFFAPEIVRLQAPVSMTSVGKFVSICPS
jgi:putative peptidoglycan lipid II flippase